jgi:aerotolerance regulator-like protein/VWA domain-containing protein
MGILAPWSLLALATLAVPVYLHLLRRHASTPRPFSSLIFFEPRTQSAVRHRRLRYRLLLALRLLLLLLPVLAFANPFILRTASAVPSRRLVLLVIDRTFSMRAGSRLEDAKREALALLAQLRATQRVQVMALGSHLEVLTYPMQDAATQRAAVAGIQAADSRGDLSELVIAARQAMENTRSPIELHLFSDLQRSALPANLKDLILPDAVNVELHPVARRDTPNWSVETVSAPAQIWGGAKDVKPASVQAVVAGFATPAADRSVSLWVNGKSVASQLVHVPAGGRVTVQFTNLLVPHGFSRCEVRIDSADVLPQDDTYRFAVERSDPQQVLFIHADTDARSPLYFGNALAAADGAAFSLQSVAVGPAARLALNPYAFVVVSNLAALPPALQSELQRYVRAGGSVLVALGTGAAGHDRVPLFESGIQGVRDYASAVAAGAERYSTVGETDLSQSWVGALSLWSGVKFFYVPRVDEANSEVIARLTDRTPLLLEKKLGEGRVLLLASGLEGLTNDLPTRPAFVAFISQLSRHLSGVQPGTAARMVDSILELHSAEQPGLSDSSRVEVIDPEGGRPLSLTQAQSAATLRLTQAGFYQLRRADGHQQLIGVNVDPRESDLALIPEETLALWTGHPARQNATVDPTPRYQQPYPLWWFIMLLALGAAFAQSWLADRQLGTTRDQP